MNEEGSAKILNEQCIEKVDIASNEIISPIFSEINRNIDKLLSNDNDLYQNSKDIYTGIYRLMKWEKNKVYSKNDVVLYQMSYVPPTNKEAYDLSVNIATQLNNDEPLPLSALMEIENIYSTTTIYCLRSLKNNNTSVPKMTLVDMIPVFDASDWKNENTLGSIFTDYGEIYVKYILSQFMDEMHNSVYKYHKFGQLSAYSEMKQKVLLLDFSNLDSTRKNWFYPTLTEKVEPTTNIIGGTVHIWDCGLLEYDIEYKLGDTKTGTAKYNVDGSIDIITHLNANMLDLRRSKLIKDPAAMYDNSDYYLTDNDASIFIDENTNGKNKTYNVNNISQNNVNDTVNAFAGTLEFPISFIDTNYMIFGSQPNSTYIVTTDDTSQILRPNVNNIVYVNKAQKSITALLIIPTYDGIQRVLGNNRFRCQIIGRWK